MFKTVKDTCVHRDSNIRVLPTVKHVQFKPIGCAHGDFHVNSPIKTAINYKSIFKLVLFILIEDRRGTPCLVYKQESELESLEEP
jgi:hypothetical protein